MLYSNNIFYYNLDKGYVEILGPLGLYKSIYYYLNITRLKTFIIYNDILYIFIYVLVVLVVLLCSYQSVYLLLNDDLFM